MSLLLEFAHERRVTRDRVFVREQTLHWYNPKAGLRCRAEGRPLQADRETGCRPRVAGGHGIGNAESWTLTTEGLISCQHPGEVCTVTAGFQSGFKL